MSQVFHFVQLDTLYPAKKWKPKQCHKCLREFLWNYHFKAFQIFYSEQLDASGFNKPLYKIQSQVRASVNATAVHSKVKLWTLWLCGHSFRPLQSPDLPTIFDHWQFGTLGKTWFAIQKKEDIDTQCHNLFCDALALIQKDADVQFTALINS